MPAEIKIPFAERPDGSLVHVSQVDSGFQPGCLCIGCGQPLVARKGGSVSHHFAHHAVVECNAETVLHKAAKRILSGRLQAALASKTPLQFTWECSQCEDEHAGDLLRRATGLAVERLIDNRRPDITLHGATGAPGVAIEVVVTHDPEQGAREFYRAKNIHLVEFHIGGPDDLIRMQKQTPLIATFASYCPIPAAQLREIKILGAKVRLQHVAMETNGDILRIRTVWREEEAPAVDVRFRFTSARTAAAALIALKVGTLDGLYGLEDPPHSPTLEATGIVEAYWRAHGYHYLWRSGVGTVRLWRRRKPSWAN